MKRMVWIFAIALIFLGCPEGDGVVEEPLPEAAGSVHLLPSSSGPLVAGETFVVKVMIDRIPNIFQGALRIQYDASALTLEDFQPGEFLKRETDPPHCVGLLSVYKALPQNNQLIVVVSRKGKQCGNTDEVSGEWGTLVFRVTRGVADARNLVTFSTQHPEYILFRDSEGNPFPVGEITPEMTRLQVFAE